MHGQQLFDIWAPRNSIWSRWAKPALFAQNPVRSAPPHQRSELLDGFSAEWAPSPFDGLAIILDLPGAESVATGLVLAAKGFQPVPLFNAVHGPGAIVKVEPIMQALSIGAEELHRLSVPPQNPPAFLLDANRSSGKANRSPGRFDNRWLVFPQDFPSANFLLANRIKAVLVVQIGSLPQDDLAHVLLRWRNAGIEILRINPSFEQSLSPMRPRKPGHFGALWYRTLVMLGLRRNSAGGFGSMIPEVQSSSGGYG
jgi:hypothetical protein